jgi:GTPase
MAFLDETTITVKAGKGGNGVVRWRREKFIARGGPAGGDGGKGGDVYIRAVKSLRVLDQYKSKKEFEAQHGEEGREAKQKGAQGENLYLEFPVGTTITIRETGVTHELTKEKQEIKILQGGAGGYGNEHFKSSTNQAPQEATNGKEGGFATLDIVVTLIADVGLIGFPNAGKSSLLNALTNAQAKIGDYAFTTLEPNLGDFHGYIIADIPGLIEGASEGKGLGHKFLKHIEKTKVLVHLISFDQPERMQKAYEQIRTELSKFSATLPEKEEIVILTKTDVVPSDIVEKTVKKFKNDHEHVFALSLFDDSTLLEFTEFLSQFLQKEA